VCDSGGIEKALEIQIAKGKAYTFNYKLQALKYT
jgi:hypothetical protein